jgi:hypothetical protein
MRPRRVGRRRWPGQCKETDIGHLAIIGFAYGSMMVKSVHTG